MNYCDYSPFKHLFPMAAIDLLVEIVKVVLGKRKPGRFKSANIYKIACCILYKLKTGVGWKSLKCLSMCTMSWNCVYRRFALWRDRGVFLVFWKTILEIYINAGNYISWSNLITDTTKTKSYGGIDCVGKNPTDRGRNGTKISAIVDKKGIPISIHTAPANIHDSQLVEETFEKCIVPLSTDKRWAKRMNADAAYDSKNVRSIAKKYGYEMVTVKNFRRTKNHKKKSRGRKYIQVGDNKPFIPRKGSLTDKIRWRVEAFFGWMDMYYQLTFRRARLIRSFDAFIHIFCGVMILKRCC